MSSILFYAGPSDNAELRDFINSLGLNVFEAEFQAPGKINLVQQNTFHGFITYLSSDQLNPYPGPAKSFPYQISHITDPIIMWTPSYTLEYEGDKYIIHGDLTWEFEDKNRAEEQKMGKQFYGKLSRWIRKNWPPPAKRDSCRGPEAHRLIQYEGYIPRGIPPTANIEYIET